MPGFLWTPAVTITRSDPSISEIFFACAVDRYHSDHISIEETPPTQILSEFAKRDATLKRRPKG